MEVGDVIVVEELSNKFPGFNNDMEAFFGIAMTVRRVSKEITDQHGFYQTFRVKENLWHWSNTLVLSGGTSYEDEEI